MKKISLALAVLLLALSCAACNTDKNNGMDTEIDTSNAITDTQEPETLPDGPENGNVDDVNIEEKEAMAMYAKVLKNQEMLYNTREDREMYLRDCEYPYMGVPISEYNYNQITFIDLDGDGVREAAIKGSSGDVYVLHCIGDKVYAYSYVFLAVDYLFTDGTMSWHDVDFYGISRQKFTPEGAVSTEVCKTSFEAIGEDGGYLYYIDGEAVTAQEYSEYSDKLCKNKVVWLQYLDTFVSDADANFYNLIPADFSSYDGIITVFEAIVANSTDEYAYEMTRNKVFIPGEDESTVYYSLFWSMYYQNASTGFTYKRIDLDDNGVKELILCCNNYVLAVFTVKDGKPVCLIDAKSGNDDIFVSSDGQICRMAKYGFTLISVYEISNGELVNVVEIGYDDSVKEGDKHYYKLGDGEKIYSLIEYDNWHYEIFNKFDIDFDYGK